MRARVVGQVERAADLRLGREADILAQGERGAGRFGHDVDPLPSVAGEVEGEIGPALRDPASLHPEDAGHDAGTLGCAKPTELATHHLARLGRGQLGDHDSQVLVGGGGTVGRHRRSGWPLAGRRVGLLVFTAVAAGCGTQRECQGHNAEPPFCAAMHDLSRCNGKTGSCTGCGPPGTKHDDVIARANSARGAAVCEPARRRDPDWQPRSGVAPPATSSSRRCLMRRHACPRRPRSRRRGAT